MASDRSIGIAMMLSTTSQPSLVTAPGAVAVPAPLSERREVSVDGYDVSLTGNPVAGTTSELTITVRRDGQVITANQRVILRPGQNATASFADLGQRREASARAGGN